MTRLAAILLIIFVLGSTHSIQAQPDTPPPYLYYYSQLLGGLIIERADGTDSRQIAADVIPPNMSGLNGPGWSPSGKYFAANGFNYGDYNASSQGSYLIDTQGHRVFDWLDDIKFASMQWSPNGDDWLLIGHSTVGSVSEIYPVSFWLVNPNDKKVLAAYAADFRKLPYEWSNVIWEPDQKQIRFYIAPEIFSDQQYFQITMKVDGTVLKQPVTKAEFEAYFTDPMHQSDDTDLYEARGISPSGSYEASGKYPTVLHELKTGRSIELPTHSQGTICRSYEWSSNERYIITLDGTLRAGGGCGGSVMGVTDQHGKLWRELGDCTWGISCVGWLSPQMDISLLPSGQPRPIQLDPVAYEPAKIVLGWDDTQIVHLRCDGDFFNIIGGQSSDEVLFQLQPDEPCPYHPNDSFADIGLQMTFAYDSQNKLLATYFGSEKPVSIWSIQNGIGTPMIRLNTYGYELQFTDDGKYLRARNVNGWKIYSVADILASAKPQE